MKCLTYHKSSSKKVGIFPDRLIFKSKEGNFEALKKYVDDILNELAEECEKSLQKEHNLAEIFKQYFQIYYIEKEINEQNTSKIIEEMSKYLDGIELRRQYLDKDENILKYLVPECNNRVFIREEGGYINSFPCIADIATAEVKKQNQQAENELEDDDVYEALKKIIKL